MICSCAGSGGLAEALKVPFGSPGATTHLKLGRYPGEMVLARPKSKRRGGRRWDAAKRHFQHSLTVEKTLCDQWGTWRAGGRRLVLCHPLTSYLHRVLQHLRKIRIGLDVWCSWECLPTVRPSSLWRPSGPGQVTEERVGQRTRSGLGAARRGRERSLQPHQAQRLRIPRGRCACARVLGMSCPAVCDSAASGSPLR